MSNFYRESLLDDDIERLRRWYEAKFGKEFCIGDHTTDIYVGVKRDTDYPLPDSHQAAPSIRKTPRLPQPVKHVDRVEYNKRVTELINAGYIDLIGAAIRIGKSKEALRADMYAGNLKVTNVLEGVSARGTNLPRYFIHPNDIMAYVAWCNEGRQRAGKWQVKSKKDKTS